VAHAPAVVDERVVAPDPVRPWDAPAQVALGELRCAGPAQAQTVGHPEDMGVDRQGGHAEGGGQDHARRLPADPGKGFEGGAARGHLTAVAVDQDLAERLQVTCLGAVQSKGSNRPLDLLYGCRCHGRGVAEARE
jgi:hypothetical protein